MTTQVAAQDALEGSNSLTDLAVRIKAEHDAAAASLRDSVRRPSRRAKC
jgi:hypothetical protein